MSKVENVAFYDLHTRIRDPLVHSMLRPREGETILDLGSGTGYFAEKICNDTTTVVCLDISLANLLSIKARGNRNLFLVNAQAEYLPLRDGLCDQVFCSEVLEHIESDKEALREVVRILMPGGTLVITVPCSEFRFPSLVELLRIKTVHDYEGPEKHYKRGYTLAELSDLLRSQGMEVSDHAYFSHFFSKLILDVISISHLLIRRVFMGQKVWHWADIQDLNTSRAFTLYRVLFPLFLMISKLDKIFFVSSRVKGCGVAVRSVKRCA